MFADTSWSLGLAFLLVSLLTTAGIVVWVLLRQEKKRSFLPILEVVQLEIKAVPKLRWNKPPLWSFVCFLIAAFAISIFALEPTEALIKQENLDLRNTHVIFDLSPSVSANITPQEYVSVANEVLTKLDSNTRLSFSLSSSPEIFPLSQRTELSKLIGEKGFHRAGFKFGVAVEKLLASAPDIEQLVLVTDNDRASWEDFNWSYLEKKVQISWYPLTKTNERSNNIFIDEVKAPPRNSQDNKWVIIVRRSGAGDVLNGKLTLSIEGKVLGDQSFRFDGNMSSIELEMKGPPKSNAPKTLEWTLSTEAPGDLGIDNTFRSASNGREQKATLISQPGGEMFLEDAFFHLKTSLDVLGFKTSRYDNLQRSVDLDSPLIVAEAKPTQDRSFFCPVFPQTENKGRQVWLVPSEGMRDYSQICACAAGFIQAPKVLSEVPNYCEGIETQEQYFGVLQSIGALQLGGNVAGPTDALAMQFLNKSSGIRLLAYGRPLSPNSSSGISFARLPIIIHAILQIAPLQNQGEIYGLWPRIDSITDAFGLDNLALSNVPFMESSLQTIAEARLPTKLGFGEQGLIRESASANREKDAKPWVILCLAISAAAIWLELFGQIAARIFRKQAWVQRWFLLFLIIAMGTAPKLEAQVRLNLLGYSSAPNLSQTKRDVMGRTSMELIEQSKLNSTLNDQALADAWLWVAQAQAIESLSAKERGDLNSWIQRGGFLVVENYKGTGQFRDRLAAALPQGQWKPIPPDHELMRSFHLLASLPLCGEVGWEGFQFDQRLAVLMIPGDFLGALTSRSQSPCFANLSSEQASKIFINIMMVVLTTDYKKDQVHLPEILKRLR